MEPKSVRNRRERRDAILKIAGPIFLEKGYDGASMAEIAAAVGGSKTTLYGHFPSKEALFESFIRAEIDRRADVIIAMPDDPADPETSLYRVGRAILEEIVDKTIDQLERIVIYEGPRFPSLGRAYFESGQVAAENLIANYLERATAAGSLAVPDTQFAADQFLMLCQVKVVLPMRLGLEGRPNSDEIDRVVRGAVSVFLTAYAPGNPTA